MAKTKTKQIAIASKSRTYVIVGDWVVDENWFLVRHYSELSKHTGDAHYRRLESEDVAKRVSADKIIDLCGAGHLARVLYLERQRLEAEPGDIDANFELLAIGKWHKDDESFLTHLLHSGSDNHQCTAGRPGYRIIYPTVCNKKPAGITLYTLNQQAPTLRAVRLYHQRSDGWQIVSRVDWEPPMGSEKRIDGKLPLRNNVQAIIIDDLEKGTVTRDLVNKLLEAYPKAHWYVRAKCLNPAWFYSENDKTKIDPRIKEKLALFVIGPEVSPQLSPFECWHRKGRITQEAMEVLGKVPACNVVLLFERRELIGRFKDGDSDSIIWGHSELDPSAINQVGWADAVMAGLVHYMNPKHAEQPCNITEKTLANVLKVADTWRGVTGVPGLSSQTRDRRETALPSAHKSGKWAVEEKKWKFAHDELGIIDGTLEVWRASTRLGGYIACTREKLDILDEIGRHLRPFSRGPKERSLGILIQADPGTGKSHLAKCLAEAFGFELIECDVSQMVHREELFEFFDKVATRQVRGDKPVLVFVDEINATIENSPVYGAFLAPLESNHYARRGQLHTLKPCVWLFTGTCNATKSDEKQSDFLSRMTLQKRIDYKYLHEISDRSKKDEEKVAVCRAAKLEQVYFGAAMVIRHFTDVTKVEKRLLKAFYDLDPAKSPFRTIRQVAAMLKNVRHGSVTIENIADVSMLVIDPNNGEECKEMVSLVAKP